MTNKEAVKHLENMKWLLGVNNTTVDDIPLTKVIDDIAALLKAQEPRVMAGAELTDAELIEEIRKAPIVLKPNVDAVPVVRCRDCKHRDPEDKKCDCGAWTVQGLYFPRPDNWYCPNGERRDSECQG